MNIHIYVYIYVCNTYLNTHIDVYVHIYMYVHIFTCIHIHICVSTSILFFYVWHPCINTQISVSAHVPVCPTPISHIHNIHMYIYIHNICMYIYMNIRTCISVCIHVPCCYTYARLYAYTTYTLYTTLSNLPAQTHIRNLRTHIRTRHILGTNMGRAA